MKNVFFFVVLLFTAISLAACGKPQKGDRGDTGAVGAKGETGAAGTNGENGQDGRDGADGVDATPVTLVKLCPGTTTYPTVFVELALCIDHKLYAIYSSKSVLVEIPPGNYTSDSIGSACSLTVAPNCVVTH